jgi:acetyltransferase-like isoleucine patch superfamily enzyme
MLKHAYESPLRMISHLLRSPRLKAGASRGIPVLRMVAFTPPIAIEDGLWIEARSVILPGVTIRAGAVIAAGSLVTGYCEPNSLDAGTPAARKSALSPSEMSVLR